MNNFSVFQNFTKTADCVVRKPELQYVRFVLVSYFCICLFLVRRGPTYARLS